MIRGVDQKKRLARVDEIERTLEVEKIAPWA